MLWRHYSRTQISIVLQSSMKKGNVSLVPGKKVKETLTSLASLPHCLLLYLVFHFCSSPPCISIHCSMKREREERSIERIIGRGCDTSCHLFRGGEERASETGRWGETESGGNGGRRVGGQCYRANAMFLKHTERLKWERVCRCCGSGRERKRGGDQERWDHRELLVTYFLSSLLSENKHCLHFVLFLPLIRRAKGPLAPCFPCLCAPVCHHGCGTCIDRLSGTRPRMIWEYQGLGLD